MEKNKQKGIKKFGFAVSVFLIVLGMLFINAHAYDSSYQGANVIDKWGYFYFKINGPSTTNLQIRISRSASPGWNTFRDKSTTWTATIYSGTNNHNVRFSNGAKSISVSTSPDIYGYYYIFNLPLVYDMPAHYQYTSWGSDRPSINARLSFEQYHPVNDMPNTASTSGGHLTYASSRSINLQINASHCGIKTFSKYFYNSSIWFNLGLANRSVTYTDGLGTTLKTQTVSDNGYATPPASPSRTGYSFAGWDNSSGPICGGNRTINATWSINTYTNSIAHWASGFRYGEGNNGSKNMFNIANTSFSAAYGSTYTMNSGRATSIPKGFYLTSSFGTSSISGSWGGYGMGTNVTQKPNAMYYEYDYAPYNYLIAYNLDGGTNSTANPSSYNVLYGVSLQNPSRSGYIFMGWYNGGTRVTGINQGANANFSGASDMYSKLSSRTIGNITLTAKWRALPTINTPVVSNPDNNEIKPFISNGKLVIQKNDVFTAIKYATAVDADGKDITNSLRVISNTVPLQDSKAYQSGTYTVTYTVTDSYGATSTKSMTVIVNDPPKLNVEDRYFFKEQENVSHAEMIKKMTSFDKEDGDISNRIKVKRIIYSSNLIVDNPDKLKTDAEGDFTVIYEITDNYRKTITKSAVIYVRRDIQLEDSRIKTYPRSISKEYIYLISPLSIWKREQSYYSTLVDSVNRSTENQAVSVWEFNKDESNEARSFSRNNKPSKEANQKFITEYRR